MSCDPGRDGLGEEYPDMASVPRSRPLQGGRNRFRVTGVEQRPGVVRPAFLVKIGCKEPTRLVLQQWINPGDKTAGARVAATQMFLDDILGGRDECLMRAFSTFHLRLAANAFRPFIGASRRISRAPGLSVFPSNRKNIGAADEQTAEQPYFCGR